MPLQFLIRFGVLLFALGCGSPSAETSIHPSRLQADLRSAEVPLAKKNSLYGVVNLVDRTILMKIRGETLREIRILDLKVHREWPHAVSRARLSAKALAATPHRTVIDPIPQSERTSDTEAITFERVEDSLELEDMPVSFTLDFSDGASILVLPRSAKPARFVLRGLPEVAVRGVFLLRRLLSFSSPAATIVVQEDDARSIYWMFAIDQPTLIAQ